MTTLQTDIAACLAWIDAELAIQDAMTEGPWRAHSNHMHGADPYVCDTTNFRQKQDALGIVHARNGYADVLRGIRIAIEKLIELMKDTETVLPGSPSWAESAIRDILATWRASQ